MPKIRIAAPPSAPSDPHAETDTTVEYEVLHDSSGHRCGIVAKGNQSGRVMEKLCRHEDVTYDPGDTRTGRVRWVPARKEQAVERWLLPVENGAPQQGSFLATYIDNR